MSIQTPSRETRRHDAKARKVLVSAIAKTASQGGSTWPGGFDGQRDPIDEGPQDGNHSRFSTGQPFSGTLTVLMWSQEQLGGDHVRATLII